MSTPLVFVSIQHVNELLPRDVLKLPFCLRSKATFSFCFNTSTVFDTLPPMKFTKKNSSLFVLLFLMGLVTGSLAWELLERIIGLAGGSLDLGVGPVGLDLDVLAIYIKINPGSLLGAAAGVFFFVRA